MMIKYLDAFAVMWLIVNITHTMYDIRVTNMFYHSGGHVTNYLHIAILSSSRQWANISGAAEIKILIWLLKFV